MLRRIAAIVFIFVCASISWMILAGTLHWRTNSSDSGLRGRVVSTWGAPHEQKPPSAGYNETISRVVESVEDGKKTQRTVNETVFHALPLDSSRIEVALELEHRQKGLLWFSAYKVVFDGVYTFQNSTDRDRPVIFTLHFPAAQATYDDLVWTAGGAPLHVADPKAPASGTTVVGAGKTVTLRLAYRSQGLERWSYNFGGEVSQVRDFAMRMTTNFKDIDFPDNTLSPSVKRETPLGWELVWNYKNLVSGFPIVMVMPEKLQPGPLAGEISLFAPVSLFFFFFLMFIITLMRGIDLHPMNYFFLAAAFFSFHLLLAYLADHLSIHLSFVVCSAVSLFLVVSYLRLVVGMRFAAVEAAAAQFLYLILFSYAFFYKGFTGLAVTIGSILTLFAVMQMTGRIRWSERFQ
jgi:inner membrane protein involved in colicin E2 resistance